MCGITRFSADADEFANIAKTQWRYIQNSFEWSAAGLASRHIDAVSADARRKKKHHSDLCTRIPE
jgi:hypothetical protein